MTAALLLILLAADPLPAEPPITVTSHRWAPFISPMGEPFRARGAGENMLAAWFVKADRNRDGWLTESEMRADAARFFALLDEDRSGAIDPPEIARYEWELAPDIQVGNKQRPKPGEPPIPERKRGSRYSSANGLQGAARYTLLNMPQPVAAADTDFNRQVTRGEFDAAAVTRFHLLDPARGGGLTLARLEVVLTEAQARKGKPRGVKEPRDRRVANPFPVSSD